MDTPALSPPRTVLLLLFLVVRAALAADTPVYFKLGGGLELKPAKIPAAITSVSWKHNGDVVVEWVDPSVELGYWGILKDRASLDKSTGVLTITDMIQETEGVYTVEINDHLQPDGYRATAVKEVQKPEVVVRPLTCSNSFEKCTLSCIGDITGAEPVTFFWKLGEEEWKEDSKTIEIINMEEEKRPKTYSCRMKNPVSVQDSQPLTDPFSPKAGGGGGSSSNGAAIGGSIAAILVLVVVVGGLLYYFREKEPVSGCLTGIRSLRGEGGEGSGAVGNGGASKDEAGSTDTEAVKMMPTTS